MICVEGLGKPPDPSHRAARRLTAADYCTWQATPSI